MWNNLKSECAERFVKAIKNGEYSISEECLTASSTTRRNAPTRSGKTDGGEKGTEEKG